VVGRGKPFCRRGGEGGLGCAVGLETGLVFCNQGVEVPVFEVVGVREGKGGFEG